MLSSVGASGSSSALINPGKPNGAEPAQSVFTKFLIQIRGSTNDAQASLGPARGDQKDASALLTAGTNADEATKILQEPTVPRLPTDQHSDDSRQGSLLLGSAPQAHQQRADLLGVYDQTGQQLTQIQRGGILLDTFA